MPEGGGHTIGRAKQPPDRPRRDVSDPDLRGDADGQDAGVDQLGERSARRHALEHLEEDERAHLEPNDPGRHPLELSGGRRADELADEHGGHRREGNHQRQVVRHPEVRVTGLVQDRVA